MVDTCCFRDERAHAGRQRIGWLSGGFVVRFHNKLRYGPARRIFNARTALLPSLALVVFLALGAVSTRAEIVLLGLGDSLMAGYGLDERESFTVQLEAALRDKGHDVRLVNAGVSGDTSAGGRARLDWALAEKPDAAIVELGANDGLRGLEPGQLYENLDAILTRLKQEGVPVLLAGMLAPPNFGTEYAKAFKAVYIRLAEKHGSVFYPFFLDGVAAEKLLNQGDGIHPNREGVAIIVERILPKVEELLGRVKKTAG
ncbi:MAG: arylesterase [Alphaproteobacteria bacterium]|nr:arylesterase [Alphaproteobacteria bacterium]MBU0798286.1 arylesterase [Alphaproteobacteria bacterium]MBU0889136.1 arylesterase [Alphaproteobacteria bacterium]MBU1812170.1 arylesterase [Alphaproteobacteria bacterium]